MEIEWTTEAHLHMLNSHGVTPQEAHEAVDDIDAVWWRPDPKSKSGLSDRCVGYSHTRREILVVITMQKDGHTLGINAWPANTTYSRIYREGQRS